MSKFRNVSDSMITKMFVGVGGVCIAVVLLLSALVAAYNIQPVVCFAAIFASLAVLIGLFYALDRISKRPRFMFSLK